MKKTKLGELIRIQHGYAFKSENYVDKSAYRLLTLGNFADGNSFKYNDAKATYYGADFPEEFILNEGDLVMPLTEQVVGLFGNTAFVPKTQDYKFVLNQRVGKVIFDENKINKYYLHFLLATNEVKQQIEARASGTRQRNISPENVYDVEVIIPNIDIQNRIGNLLYSIELKQISNNRINAELESMAKIVYDYWFTQFDFPDENGKPYKSSGGKMVWNEELKREIPEGWGIVSFSDLVSFEKGKIPEQLFQDKKGISFSPYLTIDVVNGGQSQYCATDKMPYCNGETIMVMDGAASGDVYVGNKGVLGSTFAMLKPKNQSYSNAMIYRMLKNNEIIYKKANTGSTVPHANRKFIEAMRIAVPTNIELFSKTFDTIQAKIEKCKEENQQLASLRDWLLPMLMNGQVGFEGVE